MNLYERIQCAIDYIESNLDADILITEAARRAFMSRAGFYRLFNAFTGYDVKEYIRGRRFDRACLDIESGVSAAEVALRYGFASQEAFIKSFKAVVGTTPGNYGKAILEYNFRKVNIVESNFEVQDMALKAKYPEISVLANMPRMRVASYWAFGENPEDEGAAMIKEWAAKNHLLSPDKGARIFGCDYPAYFAHKRGYEYWITVPGDFQFKADDPCKEKILPGGMYALITMEYKKGDFGDFIGKHFHSVEIFAKWLRESDYGFAFHPYMEENVPEDAGSETQRFNQYFPISRNPDTKKPVVTELPACTVAVFHENNQDFIGSEKAWDLYYKWSEMSGDYQKHRVFQVQESLNKMYAAPTEFWVTNPPENAELTGLELKNFPGGRYLAFTTLFKSAQSELEENCYDIYMNGGYDRADRPLIMQFQGMTDNMNDRTKFWLYYPLR